MSLVMIVFPAVSCGGPHLTLSEDIDEEEGLNWGRFFNNRAFHQNLHNSIIAHQNRNQFVNPNGFRNRFGNLGNRIGNSIGNIGNRINLIKNSIVNPTPTPNPSTPNPSTGFVSDKCADRQVCYTTCNSIFANNGCSKTSFGILIDDVKLYNRACKIRSLDQDSLYNLISTMTFGGSVIKTDNPALFKYFKDYIKEIRAKDWCQAEGTKAYEDRQNEYLQAFETNTVSETLKSSSIQQYLKEGLIDTKGNLINKMVRRTMNAALGNAANIIKGVQNFGFKLRSGMQLSNSGIVRSGPIQAFQHISNMARVRQNNHLANIKRNTPNFFTNKFPRFKFGRRVLDLEEIPNSYLGLLEEKEENILEEEEEENVLEATTQGFFKKLFKKIGNVFKKIGKAIAKIAKGIGKFFKKIFQKKTASQITISLIDSLDYGTNINLFIIKQKSILLYMFRNQQLQQQNGISSASCLCSNVLKYIDVAAQKNGYNQRFLEEMNTVCSKQPNCVTSGTTLIDKLKQEAIVDKVISSPNDLIKIIKKDIKKN